jgi:hypothetical protein
MTPVIVKAYKTGEDTYMLNSSQNPEAYFTSPGSGLFGNVFKSQSELTKKSDL